MTAKSKRLNATWTMLPNPKWSFDWDSFHRASRRERLKILCQPEDQPDGQIFDY